jgi:hypothetical protein
LMYGRTPMNISIAPMPPKVLLDSRVIFFFSSKFIPFYLLLKKFTKKERIISSSHLLPFVKGYLY